MSDADKIRFEGLKPGKEEDGRITYYDASCLIAVHFREPDRVIDEDGILARIELLDPPKEDSLLAKFQAGLDPADYSFFGRVEVDRDTNVYELEQPEQLPGVISLQITGKLGEPQSICELLFLEDEAETQALGESDPFGIDYEEENADWREDLSPPLRATARKQGW